MRMSHTGSGSSSGVSAGQSFITHAFQWSAGSRRTSVNCAFFVVYDIFESASQLVCARGGVINKHVGRKIETIRRKTEGRLCYVMQEEVQCRTDVRDHLCKRSSGL